jgi:CheY-like chemotaxis protein
MSDEMVLEEMARERFAPTILLVDDDKLVTRRWRREFHDQTSLGVVVANSLAAAADIVEANDVQIDAVVSDLIFDRGTDDVARHLHTGVDFLSWIINRRQNLPLFVMSATDNMVNFRQSLEDRSVVVEEYFDKFVSAQGQDPAWLRIQHAILLRKFGGRRPAGLPVGHLDDGNLLSEAVSRLQLSVRTYIQELNEYPTIRVLKPVEAICVAQDGAIKAYAPSLGLLSSVSGETIAEAVDELSSAIGTEAEFLLKAPKGADLSDYANRIASRFREYFVVETGETRDGGP